MARIHLPTAPQPTAVEENVIRTNPWKGEFSPSSLVEATCPRKYLWNKILGLQVDRPKTALVYGSAIHAGVETYYKCYGNMDWEQAAKQAVMAFIEYWNKVGMPGDRIRNSAVGIKTIGEYCRRYQNDRATFIPGLVECDQWIQMPNDTMLLVKIDRVRNDNGFLTICDTKTTSGSLTDYYFKQYENCVKVSLYYYVVMTIMGQCDSIQIDGIAVPYPDFSSTKTAFDRRNFMRTEQQIKDALNTYCHITDYLVKGIKECSTVEEYMEHFYCNQKNCTDWGGCPMLNSCTYGFLSPDMQCNIVATNHNGERILEYVKEEDWNGLNKLEITAPEKEETNE